MERVSTEYAREALDEDDAAVVYVLSEAQFERERIPGAINIPEKRAGDEFPERFDEDDEIILYCASEHCQASPRTAMKLESMGFENVKDYEGGLAAWKDAGLPTEGEAVQTT